MERLRAKRSREKASVLRMVEYAEELPVNVKFEDIQTRLDKLDVSCDIYHATQDALLEKAVDPTAFVEDADLIEFENTYYKVKALLTYELSRLSRVDDNTTSDSVKKLMDQQASFLERMSQTCLSQVKVDKQLPKINIKPFGGDIREWRTFHDLFSSSVHNNKSLTGVQKFHYLKSFLIDESATLLSHIPITETNYLEAWEKLIKRYDRRGHIANALIQKFINLPTINQPTVGNFRKLFYGADEVLRGLRALGAEAESRDLWLIFLLVNKLDSETRKKWSDEIKTTDFPKYDSFHEFLEQRCQILETLQHSEKSRPSSNKSNIKNFHLVPSSSAVCPKCNLQHHLFQCSTFLSLNIDARRAFARKESLCYNFLRSGHNSSSCSSKNRCRTCKKRHHTLVHPLQDPSKSSRDPIAPTLTSQDNQFETPSSDVNLHSSRSSAAVANHHSVNIENQLLKVLVPTAQVFVRDSTGNLQPCRILLDTGSQASFIAENCIQRLGLPRQHARLNVSGLGSTGAGTTRGVATLLLLSRFGQYTLNIQAYILPVLSCLLPNFSFNPTELNFTSPPNLADPSYYMPGPIDIILGADHIGSVLQNSQAPVANEMPSVVNTIFGSILLGKLDGLQTPITSATTSTNCFHSTVDIDFDLQKFWNIEEVHSDTHFTEEELQAEEHFTLTHVRGVDGKYILRLPFKKGTSKYFGDSLKPALHRLYAMERRFVNYPELKKGYPTFMSEYIKLGHMQEIPEDEINTPESYYFPHHAVMKLDSSTTKLRLVFDGSSKTTHGVSLNQQLHIGPPIQRDVFSVCLRFRRHKFAFSGDIEKMFRQIRIAEPDQNFQRIVWRTSPNEKVKIFKLTTVTYGTSCAPFLAVRTLRQLAMDIGNEYPQISSIINNDFYVDDVMSGADTVEDVLKIKDDLIKVLSSAGFNLRKWSTNCWPLLMSLPEELQEMSPMDLDDLKTVKVLGLQWTPSTDNFSYGVSLSHEFCCTKRKILSDAARIFDPLGFLAPSVVLIKILFQEIWLRNYEWDEEVAEDILQRWKLLRNEIDIFKTFEILRRFWSNHDNFQLHCFCDASEKAYCAVIYCKTLDAQNQSQVTIVAAKTRVAPLKQITLPRLELCAALLLCRLFHQVHSSIPCHSQNIFAWTDSQIILDWLSSAPRRWKTFVANRTSEILSTISRDRWFHVDSASNPADCGSRGLIPSHLKNFELWWQGPNWLALEQPDWPQKSHKAVNFLSVKAEERNTQPILSHYAHTKTETNRIVELIHNTSSWTKLYRTIAYYCRYLTNLRASEHRQLGPLLLSEIRVAQNYCYRIAQQSSFSDEIKFLGSGKNLSSKNRLAGLSPFLDPDGLMRVGGRLQNSNVNYSSKHPVILHNNHHISKLLAEYYHRCHLHVGANHLFSILRQEFWIIGSRNLVRKVVHKCISCFRQRRLINHQYMADLPRDRIQQGHPFSITGCDYAGPITLRLARGRNPNFVKAFIAIFVCFAVKAIHIELVRDLTTSSFIAAFERFCARRGKPLKMYSDNGTNFQGARRILNEMQLLLRSEQHNNLIQEHLSKDKIEWSFIPPYSPHFGGLWEAGVKAVKTHLKRVIQNHVLTYEEMYTTLTTIEALLNSRPLILGALLTLNSTQKYIHTLFNKKSCNQFN